MNLLACSTPVWLNESIGKSGIEGGFASRVIFVNQKEREGEDLGWLDESEYIDSKPDEMKKLLVQDLTAISKIQGVYKTTVGWKEEYNSMLKEINQKVLASEDMKSYYSRKMWHCMKLAQILAADQSDDLIVTPDHLISARELLEFIEPDMYSAFSIRGENKSLASFHNVWEIMRKKQIWNKHILMNITHKHANSSQFDEHMRTLVQMGRVSVNFGLDGKIIYKVLDKSPLGESSVVL